MMMVMTHVMMIVVNGDGGGCAYGDIDDDD